MTMRTDLPLALPLSLALALGGVGCADRADDGAETASPDAVTAEDMRTGAPPDERGLDELDETDPPGPIGEPTITVSALEVAAGESIEVVAAGFPPNGEVEVGVGPPNSEYDVVQVVTTDGNGTVRARIPIDAAHPAGSELVFVVATHPDPGTKVVSEVVRVTG